MPIMFLWLKMEVIKDYQMKKDGLIIYRNLLERAGIGEDVDVLTKDHTIVIKPKYMTDKVRGIVKKTPLTVEDLNELYHASKGV